VYLEVEFRRVACGHCGHVKQEKLAWIADNPLYTKRFAFFVGRRCRASTLRDVAKELRLDWHTVKGLEMQYMREQLRRAGMPGPLVIGGGRSGLAGQIERNPAWICSIRNWEQRRAAAFAWP